MPAERAEAILEHAERDDLVRRLVRLQFVAVHDDRETSQPFVCRGREPFVVLTLLQLAVADHDDDPPAAAEVALRPRDPPALRDPHAERSGVRLDPGDADVGMAVEPAETAQPQQALTRNHAERVERGVQAGHVVTLRGEVHVAIDGVPPDRRGVQLLEQKKRDDVHRAERRSEVTRARALDGDESVEPARVGDDPEAFVARDVSAPNPIELGPWRQAEIRHERRRYRGRCGVTTPERSVPSASSSVFSHRKSASLEPGR